MAGGLLSISIFFLQVVADQLKLEREREAELDILYQWVAFLDSDLYTVCVANCIQNLGHIHLKWHIRFVYAGRRQLGCGENVKQSGRRK